MRLIGLCGDAGAGKGSVAAVLAGMGFLEMAFADRIYQAVAVITGYSIADLKNRRFKEEPLPWLGGKSPRHLLQTLGTEWGRQTVSPDLWVTMTMRHIDHLARGLDDIAVVITDVRFANEAEAIRQRGGVIWEVRRPGASCLDAAAAGHSSEGGLDESLVDAVIWNNSTLESLAHEVVHQFRRQFRAGESPCPV
jgi:hypothetical protein